MSDFKKKEFADIYASLKYRIKEEFSKIEDIRYSLSEIVDELTELSELADKTNDLIDAEDE